MKKILIASMEINFRSFMLLLCFLFIETGSCIVALARFKSMAILLPHPTKVWDCR